MQPDELQPEKQCTGSETSVQKQNTSTNVPNLRNLEGQIGTTHLLEPQTTADGSYTFFSDDFQEAFHSNQGARLEAELKFVKPTQLAQRAAQPTVRILDVCYGLGYNTAAALATIWHINPHCQIEWFGLELNPIVPQSAIAHHLLDHWPAEVVQVLTQLVSHSVLDHTPTSACPHRFSGHLLWGDARQTIQQVQRSGFQSDAIFLDPFSTISCPQLWTVEFLHWVVQCLAPSGQLATYSCSAAVRTALVLAGLNVGSTPGVGRKSPGTIANFTGIDIPALSTQEEEHLQTRAAIPYRDPSLTDDRVTIIQRRRQEQSQSPFETTSQWKKRWLRQESR